MASVTTVNFITGNANKLREVKAILEPTIMVQSKAVDLEEVQGSVEEVTLAKCRKAAETIQGPVLVEDTCLCFKALNDLPGPYIKWFMQSIGHQGLNNLLAAYENKSADAVCTFAYSPGPGREPVLFQGRTSGKIVPARGPADFGWDAIFEYEGKTYAEMDKAAKNKVSHRGVALRKLQDWFAIQQAE
ncbi:Inosine triphosphate pyrophosphatase [Colletotrichum orbiculare MAFF 240422]|uniref:Inosine triphosphate pyrophosphatase n=1 Tax=Colletotrichum orbiculare (strain 104-T / ATCC 96160 / CBS 514.97 / LARS 414 / MAFF 240422) TaxID=1213857 RepID=A0A484F7C8_COLOR|nr:Inosine triphosphate pyrophosphatase [Colletotrichum orbiculare MAFF 240422]